MRVGKRQRDVAGGAPDLREGGDAVLHVPAALGGAEDGDVGLAVAVVVTRLRDGRWWRSGPQIPQVVAEVTPSRSRTSGPVGAEDGDVVVAVAVVVARHRDVSGLTPQICRR